MPMLFERHRSMSLLANPSGTVRFGRAVSGWLMRWGFIQTFCVLFLFCVQFVQGRSKQDR